MAETPSRPPSRQAPKLVVLAYSAIIWHSGSSGHQPGWQRGRPGAGFREEPRTVFRVAAVVTVLLAMAALLVAPSSAAPSTQGGSGRYLVRARSAADLQGLRARAVAEGARVVRTIPQINTMVVKASAAAKGRLAADRRA